MSGSKLMGGLLLIIGTSIGGGMLALPVATAQAGFYHSVFFLLLCWLVMTSGALLVLEVNLRLPAGSNMISMARKNLGLPGEIIAWLAYLFLLYTLLAAYIAGGSDVFNALLAKIGIHLPDSLTATIFTTLFGFIVYNGIRSVDYVNRGLMFVKLAVYFLLVLIISPHISKTALSGGNAAAVTGSLMVLVTSFGFASIVPSLRDYFKEDISTLRKLIIWGSFIPLVCYILWDAAIMGVVDLPGLVSLGRSDHATSGLTVALSHSLQNRWITAFFALFTFVCMLTAFLGVSLGLFDFLADGFKLEKKGLQGKMVFLLTFLPPLAIVIISPGIYLQALSYAGICCVFLLLLLPAVMAWRGRKADDVLVQPLVPGGQWTLSLIIVVALYLLSLG